MTETPQTDPTPRPRRSARRAVPADTVRPDKPARKGSRIGRILGGLIITLIVLAAAAAAGAWYLLFEPDFDVAPGKDKEILIARGSSTSDIATTLSQAGVIDNALMFRIKARRSDADGQLKAGMYLFTTGSEYEAVLAKLAKGPDIVYYDVPIPEGFSAKQIAARFAKRAHIDEDELYSLATKGASRFADEHPYLKDAHAGSLEGYLFPATYRVKKGTSAKAIVEMMLDKFDAEIAKVDLSYAKSKNLTLEDVLTIASLIEREVKLADEFPLVSSVIYNRLRIRMRLQLDSTVFYGLPEGTKVLTSADLHNNHPYNTYSHYGLPPGPLANPGLQAIDAAAHPKKTEYLYYVLTGEDGSQTFATNYEDFMKAVAIYRKKFVNK